MAEFGYNNVKNITTGYTPFKLNCEYHPRIFYKKDVNPHSSFQAAKELTKILRNLIVAYRKNLQYAQKLQKQSYDMRTKPRSYIFGKKV